MNKAILWVLICFCLAWSEEIWHPVRLLALALLVVLCGRIFYGIILDKWGRRK